METIRAMMLPREILGRHAERHQSVMVRETERKPRFGWWYESMWLVLSCFGPSAPRHERVYLSLGPDHKCTA